MSSLIEGLREFITRDLIYVVGGGTVLSAFLYKFVQFDQFDLFSTKDDSVPFILQALAVGIAYVLGYLLQDSFSLIRIVTTSHVRRPWGPVRWMFERFTESEWQTVDDEDDEDEDDGDDGDDWEDLDLAQQDQLKDSMARAEYQRLITLMMVGSTMAPCMLATGLLIGWKWLSGGEDLDLALSIVAFIMALILWPLNWLKAAQRTQWDAKMIRRYKEKNSSGDDRQQATNPPDE